MHGPVSPWAGVEYTRALQAVILGRLLSHSRQIQSILTRNQLNFPEDGLHLLIQILTKKYLLCARHWLHILQYHLV